MLIEVALYRFVCILKLLEYAVSDIFCGIGTGLRLMVERTEENGLNI